MKTLPTTFTKSGFTFEQVTRKGLTAIYKQTRVGQPTNVHYEVGRIRQNKAREQFGTQFEASESWPSSEEWGVRAWTYPDLTRANEKLVSLDGLNA